MDVIEAIKTRRSIRAYKAEPVPKKLLTELMQTCLNSPSWANSQPWEFAIVGGAAMQEIRRRNAERVASSAKANTDIPWPSFPDPCMARIRANGHELFEALGIARTGKTSPGVRPFLNCLGTEFLRFPRIPIRLRLGPKIYVTHNASAAHLS